MTRAEGFRTPAERRAELEGEAVYLLGPIDWAYKDCSQHDHIHFVDQDGNDLGLLCVPRRQVVKMTNFH